MKPAEHMANLTQQLRSNNITNAQRRQILIDLESLLADIDNARDFHTIGSWPTLISQLVRPDRGMEAEEISIQSAAAWAIGTAVKNSYDYQLWLLEDVSFSHPSMGKIQITQKARAWDLLQSLLEEYSILSDEQLNREEYVELQKRLLYAISAGVRGNVEIQAECEPLISILSRMTSHRPTSIEVTRKIMTLIQDIVEERQYIALELLPKLSHVSSDMPRKIRLEAEMSTENASSTSSDSSADMLTVEIDGNKITAEQARLAVDSLQSTLVLGEYFFQEKWLQTIVDTANRSIDELLRISSAIEESGKLSSRINYQATLSSCVHILTSIVKQAPSVTRSFHPSLQAIITRMSSSLHEDIFADAGIDHAAILSML